MGGAVIPNVVDFREKLELFEECWAPKNVAAMNDYRFKLAKLEGTFVWHAHPDSDEAFLVLEGLLAIEFRAGTVELRPGQMTVVPAGVEHRPCAEHGVCHVLLIEPETTLNTGNVGGERTAPLDDWI